MRNYESAVSSDKELFFKMVELYQIPLYDMEDYATKREKEFLWASFNVQRDAGTKRLFRKVALEEYAKYGFNESNVNNYSRSLHKKMLVNREMGELMLVDCMETFSAKVPLKVSIDIIVDKKEQEENEDI